MGEFVAPKHVEQIQINKKIIKQKLLDFAGCLHHWVWLLFVLGAPVMQWFCVTKLTYILGQ